MLAVTVLLTAGGGVASAAETVVSFDGLGAGELVKSQYEGQGLKLGLGDPLGRDPEALGRARRIYATVIGTSGAPLQTLTVGRYTAPRPLRPSRPGHLRFVRHGKTGVLKWSAVAGAQVYRVRVTGSDGRLDTFFASPRRRSEVLPNVLPSESFTATVTAVGGPALLKGRSATVRLQPVKRRTRRRRA